MTGIEAFTHDCPEKTGGEYYERIAGDVLQDLNLLRVISKLHVSVDPTVPIFIVVGVIRKLPAIVKVHDFASAQVHGNRTTLSIGNETYLAPFLKLLWDRYGKANVEQPDRWTVVVTVPEGREVVPLPEGDSYLGFLFAKGETPAAVEAALREAHRRLAFDVRPALPTV